jgi:hypothetical protein
MIDEDGRTLEIQRLREMVKQGFIKVDLKYRRKLLDEDTTLSNKRKAEILSSANLVEKESDGEFLILDDELPICYAAVSFDFKSGKWRTKIYGNPIGRRPSRKNYETENNYLRAFDEWLNSAEVMMPAVPRGRKKSEED